MTLHPALAVIELESIARAWRVLDAMIKRAPITPWQTHNLSAGRFLILIRGPVAEVHESYLSALTTAPPHLLDSTFLPHAHPDLLHALANTPDPHPINALGVVETNTCASSIRGIDAALKGAEVHLVHLHLGQGIAGKGVFALHGALHDVQIALSLAAEAVTPQHLVLTEEIPAPHGATTAQLLRMASQSPDY